MERYTRNLPMGFEEEPAMPKQEEHFMPGPRNITLPNPGYIYVDHFVDEAGDLVVQYIPMDILHPGEGPGFYAQVIVDTGIPIPEDFSGNVRYENPLELPEPLERAA
jgi:hypothetical protein